MGSEGYYFSALGGELPAAAHGGFDPSAHSLIRCPQRIS
jgi:hypothetical protein